MKPEAREWLLTRWRNMLATEREVLAFWHKGDARFLTNGQDTTAEVVSELERRVAELESLIQRVEQSEDV